jgi:hypothetical protein
VAAQLGCEEVNFATFRTDDRQRIWLLDRPSFLTRLAAHAECDFVDGYSGSFEVFHNSLFFMFPVEPGTFPKLD